MPRLRENENLNIEKQIKKLDVVLPHFGSIFGLNESATAIILIAMGCLRKHGKGTAVRLEG